MVSSITQDPYSIVVSLNLDSFRSLNIGHPLRLTELLLEACGLIYLCSDRTSQRLERRNSEVTHMITVLQVRTLSVNGRVSVLILKHRYPDRVEVWGLIYLCSDGTSQMAREKGFIVTHFITVRQVGGGPSTVRCRVSISMLKHRYPGRLEARGLI
jgi:hypothetical protein